MKTQYKPIAMRCTQEQFESIKGKINLPIDRVQSFEHFPYLTNYFISKNVVTNINGTHEIEKRGIIETFNAEYFLDCCGREKPDEEVIFKGSELQFRRQEKDIWLECLTNYQYRIKPKPNLGADIAALQQKAKELGIKITITFE